MKLERKEIRTAPKEFRFIMYSPTKAQRFLAALMQSSLFFLLPQGIKPLQKPQTPAESVGSIKDKRTSFR